MFQSHQRLIHLVQKSSGKSKSEYKFGPQSGTKKSEYKFGPQ